MLKKYITQGEALGLAANLGLAKYINVNDLIENLQLDHSKRIRVCVVTTDKQVAEFILQDLGLKVFLYFNNVLKIGISYGSFNYTVMTEYGELSVNKDLLVNTLASSRKDVECAMTILDKRLNNLDLTLFYVPEYNCVDGDVWRCMMLEADKTIFILNANHILYASEREFIGSQVFPYYSPSRLMFGIGNAQQIKSSEWEDAVARVHMRLGEEFCVFPIFTVQMSEERRRRYVGSDVTFSSILKETQQELISLRKMHFEDLDTYRLKEFENSLIELKLKLEGCATDGFVGADSMQMDQKMLAESRKHIESSISLFLESPLVAKYRTKVGQFVELLKCSLKEDIQVSKNIKQEARALPRYLSAVWEQFFENQNNEVYQIFKHESSILIDMMNMDLRDITSNIRGIDIKENIEEQLRSAFCVHTFFARKTNSGNDLTDALTIGGLLTSVVNPLGLVAVFASEVIKIVEKDSIDNEYKTSLSEKVVEVIEHNKEELLFQVERGFAMVAELFRKEILNYYDEIISSVSDAIEQEKKSLAQITETIEIINKLI